MSQLAFAINEPPERGTLIVLTLGEIPELYASLVEVVVRGRMRCHEVTYDGRTLQFRGKLALADPENAGAELFALGQAVWDVLEQRFCETALVANPCEPGQRIFTLKADSYEEYLNETLSVRLQNRRRELRDLRNRVCG